MRIDESVRCDGCGVEVRGALFLSRDQEFCCQQCAEGYECDCPALFEDDEERARSSSGAPDASLAAGY